MSYPFGGETLERATRLPAKKAGGCQRAKRSRAIERTVQGPVSLLDTDLYTFSMGHAVLRKYPNVEVVYRFTDRGAAGKWSPREVEILRRAIYKMRKLRLTPDERAWCEAKLPWINRGYWDFVGNYRFDPGEVTVWLDDNNNLQIEIRGLWCRTIFWEVPLLALVSEVYFAHIDTDWDEEGQIEKMQGKAQRLFDAGVAWADFSTRRRRHLGAQERVVEVAKNFTNFIGTSNVYLAKKHGIKASGTMAHQWIMGHAALKSLSQANREALAAWYDVYQGSLGTALPDTYGTDAFLRDFDGVLARLFDSVRHDSGDPYEWAEKIIAHYSSLGIDWKTKPLGFTDGNTDESAIAIHKWVTARGGKCWFGIGTFMSNDYGPQSPACNIVIKLSDVIVNGRRKPVAKISDAPGKASGDPEAIRVAMYEHCGISLDDVIHQLRKPQYALPVPANCNTCAHVSRKKAA